MNLTNGQLVFFSVLYTYNVFFGMLVLDRWFPTKDIGFYLVNFISAFLLVFIVLKIDKKSNWMKQNASALSWVITIILFVSGFVVPLIVNTVK